MTERQAEQNYQRYGLALVGSVNSRTIAQYLHAVACKLYFEAVFGETFDTPERLAGMMALAMETQRRYYSERGRLSVAGPEMIPSAAVFGREVRRVEHHSWPGLSGVWFTFEAA